MFYSDLLCLITGNLRSADKGSYQLDKLNTSTAHIKGTSRCLHARCEGVWLLISHLFLTKEGLCIAALTAHLLSGTIVQVFSKSLLDHILDVALVFHIHVSPSSSCSHVRMY